MRRTFPNHYISSQVHESYLCKWPRCKTIKCSISFETIIGWKVKGEEQPLCITSSLGQRQKLCLILTNKKNLIQVSRCRKDKTLSLCLSFCVSVCLSVSVCVCLSLSLSLSLSPSVFLYLCLCQSVCLSHIFLRSFLFTTRLANRGWFLLT